VRPSPGSRSQRLTRRAQGVTVDEIRSKTAAPFEVAKTCREMRFD
jgi:acyl CoA:acetate/3-ketoacid CoA transferase beta subunit